MDDYILFGLNVLFVAVVLGWRHTLRRIDELQALLNGSRTNYGHLLHAFDRATDARDEAVECLEEMAESCVLYSRCEEGE